MIFHSLPTELSKVFRDKVIPLKVTPYAQGKIF